MGGAPASAERAMAVTAHQNTLDEINKNHEQCVVELNAAQSMHSDAVSSLQAVEKALKVFLPDYQRLVLERDEKLTQLENFNNYNMLSFTTLRDNTEKKAGELVETTEIAASAPEDA